MYFEPANDNLELEDFGNARLITILSALLNILLIFGSNALYSSISNFLN